MRVLAKIFSRLIFCLGVMITVVSCVVGSMVGSTGGTTLLGVTLISVGAAIYWVSSKNSTGNAPKERKTLR